MKFGKKIFVEILKFKELWALEKKRQFRLLFSLETLKLLLWQDSNPGPFALQSDPLILIHFLFDFCNLSEALKQSRQSNRRTIGNFVWKDIKQESLITFAWNFQDVWESTMSYLCHTRLLWESCFVKKWITLISKVWGRKIPRTRKYI